MNHLKLISTTPDKSQIPTMLTIKELAELTGLSYNFIRLLCKQNKIIYIMTGKKYLINYERFIDYLNNGQN